MLLQIVKKLVLNVSYHKALCWLFLSNVFSSLNAQHLYCNRVSFIDAVLLGAEYMRHLT